MNRFWYLKSVKTNSKLDQKIELDFGHMPKSEDWLKLQLHNLTAKLRFKKKLGDLKINMWCILALNLITITCGIKFTL